MPSDNLLAPELGVSEPLSPAHDAEGAGDGLLLDRFIEQWDHAAFRDLVSRHGPMVLGVCQRILRDAHAAEDAFQVTFLLLVRKAGSVRKRGSVGPWLYGVARRVALEARGAAWTRRREPVRFDPEAQAVDDLDELQRDELHAALHEELGRLPEKYRAPLVLCYIEGHTHEVAAGQLGWPLGTVRVRIARGRDLLKARLTRRGLTPIAMLLALSLLPKALPVRLVHATVRAAANALAGENVVPEKVAGRVVELERKVRSAMQLSRLKWVTAVVFALAVGTGVSVVVTKARAAADDAAKARAEQKKLQGTWIDIYAEKQGQKLDNAGEHALKFEGESLSVSHNGQVEEKGTIKLDPSKNPMEIDLLFQDGKHAGQTSLGIYTWDGEHLKLCVSEPGGAARPTDFSTKREGLFLVVLKRQDP